MSFISRRANWLKGNANRDPADTLTSEVPAQLPAEAPAGEALPPSLFVEAADLSTYELPVEPDEPAADPQPATNTGAVGRRLAGATSLVGLAFVLSRLLGLVRDQIIGAHYGTTGNSDAYIAAFRIPDTLFLLVIGGAVGAAFIPVFTGLMEHKRAEQAWRLANTMINASVVALSILGLLVGLLAPTLIGTLVAPGFKDDPVKLNLTVDLTRTMLLSPLFLGLGGWAQGILNARQRFVLPALAPVFYNLCIILGALFLTPIFGVQGLAYGVVAGALLHFLVQVPGLVRVGMRYSPLHLDLKDEGVSQVSKLIGPRIIGQATFQANIVVSTSILSFMPDGRVAAFNFAYLLMLLPHGVFALSMATVLFPTMSAQAARGEWEELRSTLLGGLRVLFFLTAPAAVILGLLRTEIVAVLFQFGQFGSGSVELVAPALALFACGLVSYALVEVLTRAYYALHDTTTPLLVSVATVGLNIALSWVLVFGFGMDHTALALSLALTTTLEMILLFLFLRTRLAPIFDARTVRSALTTLASSAALGAVLWVVAPFFGEYIWAYPDDAMGVKVALIVGLGLSAGCGIAAFLVVARLLRAEELSAALVMIKRRIGR